jgi:hypothetical protein
MRTSFFATCAAFLVVSTATAVGCGSNATSQFAGSDGGEGGAGSSGGLGSSGGFGNGDGGGGGDAGFAGCATSSKAAQKVPLDMVIALDTSFSMDFDQKWTNIRAALKSFVANPAYADLGIGLQFFPIRKQCSVADYAVPAVPLGLQGDVAAPISAALDAQQMSGGTPMVPMLEGLTQYLQANARPGRKPVIVLATDGVPDNTCLETPDGGLANSLDDAVLVAGQAFGGTPTISVFVIGVGKELGALDAIGVAGGAGNAVLIDTGANAQQAFLDALDNVRLQAIPCEYAIPDNTEDPQSTNVTYTPASGSAEAFGFVGDQAGCAKAPNTGWYFDDPTTPKQIILCAATCDAVKKDDRGRVDVVFGCPRVEIR